MPKRAKIYVYGVIGLGAAVALGSLHWAVAPLWLSLAVYLCVAVATSAVKLRLPGVTGTYSISFLPLLFGLNHFSFPEMMLAAGAVAVAQSSINVKKRPMPIQIAFNAANVVLSVAACFWFMKGAQTAAATFPPASFCGAAAVFFVVNTVIVSGVLSLLEGKPLTAVWENWYLWSFTYYMAGAAALGVLVTAARSAEAWLVLVPLIYLLHFYYGLSVRGAGGGGDEEPHAEEGRLPKRAHLFIMAVITAGSTLVAWSAMHWESASTVRFLALLLLAMIASGCKIALPRMTGTLSAVFVILLFGVPQFSIQEMLVVAAAATTVQCYWRARKRPSTEQALFNMSSMVLSTAAAIGTYRTIEVAAGVSSLAVALAAATCALYATNSLLVAAVLCFVDGKPIARIWQNCCFWALPYYLVGAAVAGIMIAGGRAANWGPPLMVLGMMALFFVSYRAQIRSLGV